MKIFTTKNTLRCCATSLNIGYIASVVPRLHHQRGHTHHHKKMHLRSEKYKTREQKGHRVVIEQHEDLADGSARRLTDVDLLHLRTP